MFRIIILIILGIIFILLSGILLSRFFNNLGRKVKINNPYMLTKCWLKIIKRKNAFIITNMTDSDIFGKLSKPVNNYRLLLKSIINKEPAIFPVDADEKNTYFSCINHLISIFIGRYILWGIACPNDPTKFVWLFVPKEYKDKIIQKAGLEMRKENEKI